MEAHTPLLVTLAGAFGVAFVLGVLATKLRLPPLVGYLLAGLVLGPHSPGFVADIDLAQQLAEVGVILLMFGVGLHFSPGDLQKVRRVALPGALLQMAIAFALGFFTARSWGWSAPAAVVFGLSLCVASTVVVLRVLEDRGLLDSFDGRIAVGCGRARDYDFDDYQSYDDTRHRLSTLYLASIVYSVMSWVVFCLVWFANVFPQ